MTCDCQCQSPQVIHTGDAYPISVTLKLNDDQVTSSTIDLIAKVEFILDEIIRKVYPDDVTFDDDTFLVPLTQEETFQLMPGSTAFLTARIKFAQSDNVKEVDNPVPYLVIGSQSTEVI